MTKRLKSKHKVDRRLKANLWGRPKSPFNVRAYPPGQHGQNKKGKPTDYGIQLQAKQKLKAYYGNINERQFRNIYRKALSKKGDTTENLIALLESRLDTVIYRAKLATTVFSARQMINHGHIRVNKKRVNISSYTVTATDLIEIREKSKKLTDVAYYKIPVNFQITGNFLGYIKFKRALSLSNKMLNFDKETIKVVKGNTTGAITVNGTLTIVGLADDFN